MPKPGSSQPSKSSIDRKRKNSDPGSDLCKIGRTQCSSMRDGQSSGITSKINIDDSSLIDALLTDDGSSNVDKQLCGKCRLPVTVDMVHVTSLKCCLCEVHYHGNCLDLSSTLVSFLHVVSDVGGWCCVECRGLRKDNKPATKTKKPTPIENINNEITVIKLQLEEITSCLSKVSNSLPIASNDYSTKPSYATVLRTSTSSTADSVPSTALTKLDDKFCTEVLSAMHAELNSKEQRSKNLFVTGLPISQFGSDAEQFIELCSTQLNICPSVASTFRLKKRTSDSKSIRTADKIPPLLVTLDSTDDVDLIMKWARELRNSTSQQVRDQIFINRHLTKAEALAAYNERVRRRTKNQGNTTTINVDASTMDVSPPDTAKEQDSVQSSASNMYAVGDSQKPNTSKNT